MELLAVRVEFWFLGRRIAIFSMSAGRVAKVSRRLRNIVIPPRSRESETLTVAFWSNKSPCNGSGSDKRSPSQVAVHVQVRQIVQGSRGYRAHNSQNSEASGGNCPSIHGMRPTTAFIGCRAHGSIDLSSSECTAPNCLALRIFEVSW